jgi:hypothetical protein
MINNSFNMNNDVVLIQYFHNIFQTRNGGNSSIREVEKFET